MTPIERVTESAVTLEIQRGRDGRSWIAVDSLVDIFADMARITLDGPAKDTLLTLERTFRPASTYAGLEAAAAGDRSQVFAQPCPNCGVLVINGRRMTGKPIIIDAQPGTRRRPVPPPHRRRRTALAPWNPSLDGAASVRLSEHACKR
jgi:hypothetical protein